LSSAGTHDAETNRTRREGKRRQRCQPCAHCKVARDSQPIWQVAAIGFAPPDADAIPPGWPIFIVDSTEYDGAPGLHLNDATQPCALVKYGRIWSLAASHERLEMIIDPSGKKLQTSTDLIIRARLDD
jgi:hypothetical protein